MPVKFFAFIFILFTSHFVFSQNKDSLYNSFLTQTSVKNKTIALLNYGEVVLQHDIDSAFSCGKIALVVAEKLRNNDLIANANMLLGFSEEAQGKHKEALIYFLRASALSKNSNNKVTLGQSYTAIGVVYWYQGLYEKAIEYYEKNIAVCLELNDENGLATSYGNLAIIFDERSELDSALLYYKKALNIFEAGKRELQIAACVDNMSLIFKQKKDFKSALKYNLRSYKIRESIGDTIGMLASMENLGSIYISQNKPDAAILISRKALAIAERLGAKEDMKFAYINMKEAYEAKNDFKNANFALNKIMEIKDVLRNIENTNQITELEAKFKTKEKEVELAEIKLKQELREKENSEQLKRKNFFIIILIVIGVLILLIGVLLLKRYVDKQKIVVAINKKNEAIEAQKIIIDKAYHELSEKNKDITDSIKYAQKIQQAVLPSQKFIAQELSKTNTEHFILFKPKDIVSGDFYWFHKAANELYYVTADSTGHGVPGGFMSMLGINLLNEIVSERGIVQPGEILNKLREEIIRSLKTDDGYSKDGMDAVVCKINFVTKTLEYSASNNPIYIIRNKELTVLAPQKMPVGYSDQTAPFVTQSFQLNEGDCIYTITDGYADQFGGINGKKFKYKQLKELLIGLSNEPMQTQLNKLTESFENWKCNLEQVDDVCLIGIKI